MAFSIPRVRTHHTKEPSRFAYALVPRPHIKGAAGVYELCTLTQPRRWARFGRAGKDREISKREPLR